MSIPHPPRRPDPQSGGITLLNERERRAYADGNVRDAALLAFAADTASRDLDNARRLDAQLRMWDDRGVYP